MSRYRITQSLLSAWLYSYKLDDGYERFLKTLNRDKEPPTQAMLDGQRFEGVVNSVLDGSPIGQDHEWYRPVMQLERILRGSQQQVTIFREVEVAGEHFLLHGVLDFLKAGVIYDTKYSKRYELNKYFSSPQHPMYFALVPEARKFTYLISDGKYLYRETYYPDECEPIENMIAHFMEYLKQRGLWEIYTEKWGTSNG